MITKAEYEQARTETLAYLSRAGIVLTPDEAARIEVADVGLGQLATRDEFDIFTDPEICRTPVVAE